MSNRIYPRASVHLEMMQQPENWPVWPVLPVKKSFEEMGVMLAVEGYRTTVFLTNMYAIGSLQTLIDDPTVQRAEYESLEAVCADGWVVD